jgi:CheY-like chemotaxis protein
VLNSSNSNRVLLMEDEPVIARVLKRIISAEGFESDVAENGQVAKDKINAGDHYNIFIFDIRTPVISGIQLYEYLEKEHPDLTNKVIFATGDYMNSNTRQFLDRVKRPFLAKPYTPAQVKSIINSLVAGFSSTGK